MEEPFKLPPAAQKKSWIVWGALMASLATYSMITFLVKVEPPKDVGGEQTIMLYMLSGMAVSVVFMLFAVLPKVMIKKSDPKEMAQRYFTYSIVRWAFSESVCIFGLVIFFTSGKQLIFFGFAGCSLLLLLLTAPTARDQESYARAAS